MLFVLNEVTSYHRTTFQKYLFNVNYLLVPVGFVFTVNELELQLTQPFFKFIFYCRQQFISRTHQKLFNQDVLTLVE